MDDELIKKSSIRKRREEAAKEAALKGLGSEYGDLDALSQFEESLKHLPEDETVEATEVMRIPYKNPVALELQRSKTQTGPSFVEKIRGETISQARAPKYPNSLESRASEILAESSEKAKSRFGGIKDSIDKNKELESISRIPASDESEQKIDYVKEYQGQSIPITEFFNLPPDVQVELNKTHKKQDRMMVPK
jgi:hypothetical protein